MNSSLEFECLNADNESVPDEIIKEHKLSFQNIYSDAEKIAALAKCIKVYNNDSICRLPFSTTTEAESFGAQIKFSEDNIQSRISSYRINKIQDISSIQGMNLNKGSIAEILKAVRYLSSEGEFVCISVEGPVTVASQLMSSDMFYKSLIKERTAMHNLLEIIEEGILSYIKAALHNGASIISYADPSGNIDILGPGLYTEYSGKINYNILKKAGDYLDNALIHICGRTSASLEAANLAEKHLADADGTMSFSDALIDALKNNKSLKYVGNSCIKKSYMKSMSNRIWEIKLKMPAT